jgi:hypothetical protein
MARPPASESSSRSSSAAGAGLDPELRRRLLSEARTPWRSLRRALWFALVASASLGLTTMALRASAGIEVASADLLIQVGALGLFGGLLWFDRNRSSD